MAEKKSGADNNDAHPAEVPDTIWNHIFIWVICPIFFPYVLLKTFKKELRINPGNLFATMTTIYLVSAK